MTVPRARGLIASWGATAIGDAVAPPGRRADVGLTAHAQRSGPRPFAQAKADSTPPYRADVHSVRNERPHARRCDGAWAPSMGSPAVRRLMSG